MNTKEKEVGADGAAPAVEAARMDGIESITELYTSGIERVAEFQKKGLELALQHSKDVVTMWKKLTPAAPGVLTLDLASIAFERVAETQKGAIDLVVEQTHTVAKLVKERKFKATGAVEEGKQWAKETIEHSVAAQKTALDYTAKQARTAFETAKQQFGYAGTPVGTAADSMQRGMEVMVKAHKELLDVVSASPLR